MKLSRLSLGVLLATATTTSFSASNIFPVGPNLTYGDASNFATVFSSTTNPAWLGSNLHNENNYGFGLTGGGMVRQTKLKEVIDGFQDNIADTLDEFDNGDNTALANAEELKLDVNNLILDTRDSFKFETVFAGSVPIVITNVDWGGFGIELSGMSHTQSKLLSTDKPLDIDTSYLIANPEAESSDVIDNALYVQSAFYNKVAVYSEAAVTYGNQFFSNQYGILAIGAKAKYMMGTVRKSVVDLGSYLDETAKDDPDIEGKLNDDFNDLMEGEVETQFGLDIGAMWISNHYYAGVTVMNVNSPTFTYNTIGDGPITDEKSNIERTYQNQINMNEEVILVPQGRVEAAVFTENRMWTLSGSVDTNESYDLVNNAYQWMTVSASFATNTGTDWWWMLVPDARLGYRANLAGDKESYIAPGFTFGPINLDMAMSSGAINDIQNGDVPEAFAMNLGAEVLF